MIPWIGKLVNSQLRIPRESGDDPFGVVWAVFHQTYSPRERG